MNDNRRNEKNGSCRVGQESRSDVELLDAYSRTVITVAEAVGPAVVGIWAGEPDQGGQLAPTGAGSGVIIAQAQGIGFAIPAATAHLVVTQLITELPIGEPLPIVILRGEERREFQIIPTEKAPS